MKAGLKTTEFWLTIATNLAAILGTVGGVLDPKVGGAMVVVSNVLYALVRTFAKR